MHAAQLKPRGKSADISDTAWLDNPRLFTPWTDPESGVRSYILALRVAPVQQSFYYVNPSISDDGRYYWFYCAHPPSGSAHQGRTLGLVNLEEGWVRHFPETQFSEASPFMDARTGDVYWCNQSGIWKLSPTREAGPVLINGFPSMFVGHRPVGHYATHLTRSADGRFFNIDANIGGDCYVGCAPLDGGEIDIWQRMDRQYNHGQFSPTDPDLMLIAQDFYVDRSDWSYRVYMNRLWTIRRGEKARPVYESSPADYRNFRVERGLDGKLHRREVNDCRGMHSHEWWGADGRHIWYVHHGEGHGVERVRLGTQTPELIWPHATISHAHADADECYLTGDALPTSDPGDRHLAFRDIASGREMKIVSQMPNVVGDAQRYHLHCHPQFCFHDRLICYTTFVNGQADVAFTRVEDLVARV